MKQTRFDEAQIIGILKQQEAGVTVDATGNQEGAHMKVRRLHRTERQAG